MAVERIAEGKSHIKVEFLGNAKYGFRLLRLMLNFIALGGDALVQDLPGGPCRKIASKGHRDPSSQHLTQYDQ